MKEIFDEIFLNGIDDELVKTRSPLVLAYIGDAVYELYVRLKLIAKGEAKVNMLHKEGIKYVKAKAQADILKGMESELTERELDIVRRGRNVMPVSPPKNAEIMDYRYATGFEALIGYLTVEREYDRLKYIMDMAMKEN